MILKVFKDRKSNEGWHYIDNIRSIQVDCSTWCLARLDITPGTGSAHIVCAKGGEDQQPNRSWRLEDYEKMFDYEFEREDDFYSVKVITAFLENEKVLTFVTRLGEPHTWLLNDEGKTVERL